MKKFLLLILVVIGGFLPIYAQGFAYSSKVDLGNGLYKVKSGDYYGVIDKDDNVIVSIEYQDILFRNGKALLTKNDILYGIVDSVGSVKMFDEKYKVHPRFRYVYDGYIIVSNREHKWGYINEYEEPLRIKSRMKGIVSIGKKRPTMFDDVTPFVEGCAAVYLNKSGWKHIDKEGAERYNLVGEKENAYFRSSVYKGECVIITDDGIKLYQESDDHSAAVKRILASSALFLDKVQDKNTSKLIYNEGVLTLDSLMRVVKYENENDSIVLIQRPPQKVIVEKKYIPVDTLSLEKDLIIELASNSLQCNAKGQAHSEIIVKNNGNDKFEDVSILVECMGASRNWSGDMETNSALNLSFNIPARFSTLFIKRNIKISITHKNSQMEKNFIVTIRRYTPIRSR